MVLPLEIERIAGDIRREVEAQGAELVDIQFRRSGRRGCLTILADKEGGISLDDCARINRALGEFLDRLTQSPEDEPAALRGSYDLEVNSPGLDRPLKTEKDFLKAVGQGVRLVYRDEEGKSRDFVGEVYEVADGRVRLIRPAEPQGIFWVRIDAVLKAVRDIQV